MKKRVFALMMASVMAFGLLAGCSGGKASPSPSASSSPEVTPSVEPAPVERPKVNVAMLKGPTGMGAAKLMADNEEGITLNDYTFTVYTENTEVTNALAQGDLDIAALATNVAANFYNKTKGIKIIAINTFGVLKILQNGEGEAITDLSQLKGETVFATGQGANPEYVLNYLLTESGVDPAEDVDIRWMTAEEVTQGIISGTTKFAMLPVPAATTAGIQSQGAVKQVLDLGEQWEILSDDSKLTMGCVVVRKAFAEENPDVVRDFLAEYEASITYMKNPDNVNEAGTLLEKYGIVPKAAVAMKALAQVDIAYLAGIRNIRDTIQGYYEVLYAANPASIGGGIPDDAFYFE